MQVLLLLFIANLPSPSQLLKRLQLFQFLEQVDDLRVHSLAVDVELAGLRLSFGALHGFFDLLIPQGDLSFILLLLLGWAFPSSYDG